MSERQRAFQALRGVRCPHVGDKAWWRGPLTVETPRNRSLKVSGRSRPRAKVVVLRVSASGHTIWTRFASVAQREKHGAEEHRWTLMYRNEESMLYGSHGSAAPLGTVYFP
jgi:hypothetical protein